MNKITIYPNDTQYAQFKAYMTDNGLQSLNDTILALAVEGLRNHGTDAQHTSKKRGGNRNIRILKEIEWEGPLYADNLGIDDIVRMENGEPEKVVWVYRSEGVVTRISLQNLRTLDHTTLKVNGLKMWYRQRKSDQPLVDRLNTDTPRTVTRAELPAAIEAIQDGKVQPREGVDFERMPEPKPTSILLTKRQYSILVALQKTPRNLYDKPLVGSYKKAVSSLRNRGYLQVLGMLAHQQTLCVTHAGHVAIVEYETREGKK